MIFDNLFGNIVQYINYNLININNDNNAYKRKIIKHQMNMQKNYVKIDF